MEESLRSDPVAFWGEAMADEEPLRESRFPLVDVQTAIAWRVIEPLLAGSPRVLDAGAGTGRFSLPIAARELRVTHLDISQAMLSRAMAEAARRSLGTIEFLQGDVRELSALEARSHDLTLCLDAPISYAYPDHERALAEVCRVTRDTLVLMVSSRSGVLPFFIDLDLSREFIPPDYGRPVDPLLMTQGILDNGVEDFPPDISAYLARSGKLTPPDYAFTVDELRALLNREGFQAVRMGGPGALARSIKAESLQKIRQDQGLFKRFIDLSLDFDFDAHNLGLGGVNLLVVARRRQPARNGRRKRKP